MEYSVILDTNVTEADLDNSTAWGPAFQFEYKDTAQEFGSSTNCDMDNITGTGNKGFWNYCGIPVGTFTANLDSFDPLPNLVTIVVELK
jgi:hypothetical protein